ncbi:hypothetical protein OA517_00965 [Alphaproteobacteria bacterium]|nr:hypothetical protein [Alphaproteobacteria bacterium]
MQRPLSSFLFSSYSFSKSFPTKGLYDKHKKWRGSIEVVFSWFLSVLRLVSSSKYAVVQRGKYLILIFTASFFISTTSAMTLENFHGWNIQLLEEEMIAIERSGDIEDSENIIFVMTKNNCDRVLQFFELFTLSTHPDLTKLIDKEIELQENGHTTTGMVMEIYPYKNGHMILIGMGSYGHETIKEYYTFHKRSRLTVTDVPVEEPVALRTFIDLPTIQWAMPQIEEAMDRAHKHCKKIPNPIMANLNYSQKGLKS